MNNEDREIIKQLKEAKNYKQIKIEFLSAYLISERISPYFSVYFIKKNIIPNKITIYMILSGLIGAFLFALPFLWSKILGAIFIHLWFILDCSDGEVARYTKTFSKYGKELDYIAHVINHPIFILSFFLSLNQLQRYNPFYLSIILSTSIVLDLINRNVTTLNYIIDLKESKKASKTNIKQNKIKNIIWFFINIFLIYPNIVLFGVFLYFIDYFFHSNLLYFYFILNVLVTSLIQIRAIYKIIKKFYFS
ncbi:CDP-alcohol phosphatidyltransferase family protein [Marinitoga sp. 1135]|uniref:CDP-alcohol phosphatidyltransferase family protein n=1 Tax=Marinitoga sp. 1135 TaxID=1643333 RepID=UPI001586439B|nr:CDP-alcohol phosphatidyltransferase family protein [Marinitoga sp. 1135]